MVPQLFPRALLLFPTTTIKKGLQNPRQWKRATAGQVDVLEIW